MFKKKFLSVMFMGVTWMGYAQTSDDYVTISPFTLEAGVEQTQSVIESQVASIILYNSKDYSGLQFDLKLPAGVSIYNDDGYWFDCTDRLKFKDGRKNEDFSVSIAPQSDGSYRFVIWSGKADRIITIGGSSGEAILDIYLLIDPSEFETGTKTCEISNIILAYSTGEPADGAKVEKLEYSCELKVKAKTAASGYGSFSWPHALDFSNAGVQAFVATRDENCVVSLNPVSLVPANTGIVIKGEPSTVYYPVTTDDGGTATSILIGTTEGAYTVNSNDIYAISTIDGKTAFYQVNQGVAVPQYKAYLQHTAGADAAPFALDADFAAVNGLAVIEGVKSADDTYHTIQGIKVSAPSQRGVYIHNGSKVVVK